MRKIAAIVLGLVIGLGVFLRFHQLGEESFWLDEGASVRLARSSPAEIVRDGVEHFHPPLYFLFLRGWVSVFGNGEFAVRSLSAFFGVLSIAAIYLLGALLFGRTAGRLAAALLCLSRFNLFYSQEARMYGLLGFLALASMYFFLRLLQNPRPRDWFGYLAATALGLYTHNFGIFLPAIQNLFFFLILLLPRRRRLPLRPPPWIAGQLILIVLYAPWLRVVIDQLAAMPDSPWSVARPVPLTLFYSLLQFSGSPILRWIYLGLFLLVIAAALRIRPGGTKPGGGALSLPNAVSLILLWAALPLLAPFFISQFSVSVYVHRATILSSFPLYLLAAAGIGALPGRPARWVAAVAVLALSAFGLRGYYSRVYRDQWREAVELLSTRARSGDLIYCFPLSPYKNVFRYYFRRSGMEAAGISARGVDFDPDDAAGPLPAPAGDARIWLLLSHGAIADRAAITADRAEDCRVTFRQDFINGSNVPFHRDRVGLEVSLLEKRFDPGLFSPAAVERFSRLLRSGQVPNLLRDPGFEEGGGEWGAETDWIDRSDPRGGRSAVRLEAKLVPGGNFWRLKQGPIRLPADRAYLFGAFVKTRGLEDRVAVEIREINSLEDHPYISTVGIGGDNDWTLLFKVFRPRPRDGARETEIEIRPGRVVDFRRGEFKVDDVFLVPADRFPERGKKLPFAGRGDTIRQTEENAPNGKELQDR